MSSHGARISRPPHKWTLLIKLVHEHMAAMDDSKKRGKRRNKRKFRINGPSASSSDSEEPASPQSVKTKAGADSPDSPHQAFQHQHDDESSPEPVLSQHTVAVERNAEEAFERFYLKQATTEFADDLDKLRSAGDFRGEKSVGIIVEALKQGVACFAKEERMRVGGAALSQVR